ncbi:MAG: DUF3592 domain-containing protein, partial [Gemmatimonadota bacterium]
YKTQALELRYRYHGPDQSYEGSRINFSGDTRLRLTEAKELLKRYPAGAEVEVWYDPANPSCSVLERTGARSLPTIALFAVGYGAFVVSALLFAVVLYIQAINN